MRPPRPSASRREALQHLLIAAGAVAVWPQRAESADLPHLSEQDPQAVKFGYVEVATRADATKFTGYDKAQSCENCLQLQGVEGAAFRPCQLFPGKSVAVRGWCSGWTPEI